MALPHPSSLWQLGPAGDYGIGLRHVLKLTVPHALNPPGPITGCRQRLPQVRARLPLDVRAACCSHVDSLNLLLLLFGHYVKTAIFGKRYVPLQCSERPKNLLKEELVIVVKQSRAAAGRQARG